MNFKLFTTALLATAATAAPAEQDALADALHANYHAMPEPVQRRFWVSILYYFSVIYSGTVTALIPTAVPSVPIITTILTRF